MKSIVKIILSQVSPYTEKVRVATSQEVTEKYSIYVPGLWKSSLIVNNVSMFPNTWYQAVVTLCSEVGEQVAIVVYVYKPEDELISFAVYPKLSISSTELPCEISATIVKPI